MLRQVFEPRRFVELRKQNFWKQVKSAESFGMGLFYTLNVFFIQFYLGEPTTVHGTSFVKPGIHRRWGQYVLGISIGVGLRSWGSHPYEGPAFRGLTGLRDCVPLQCHCHLYILMLATLLPGISHKQVPGHCS